MLSGVKIVYCEGYANVGTFSIPGDQEKIKCERSIVNCEGKRDWDPDNYREGIGNP